MSGFILYSMHMLSYMGKHNCNVFPANNKSINVNPIISNNKINWKRNSTEIKVCTRQSSSPRKCIDIVVFYIPCHETTTDLFYFT